MLDYVRFYIRAWDWRLFFFILLFLGLPSVYQLYRVYLIGNEIPDPGGLAIVAQWQFVGLVVEVFQEATILAIFFFLASQIRSSTAVQVDRIKSVLAFIFVASLVFSAGVFIFRDAFIRARCRKDRKWTSLSERSGCHTSNTNTSRVASPLCHASCSNESSKTSS